ncbi:glucose-6-phosphate dehydrogenase [Labedella populi]|uniref:Glucose-6-phosphate dehydrogenase n=1 Tax=Labedella populi TaxID=2498850 RepID=A0A444QBV0_9MICO|nr:glucose-6-phosphate dehydrogenase [Labedella populi]RWZ61568.1 glucose-6-phosphate dehydrogenase [Labedella populi]
MSSPVTLLILGAGGDLTKRLLLPGLGSLLAHHDHDVTVLGAGLDDGVAEHWQDLVRDSLERAADERRVDDRRGDAEAADAETTDADRTRQLVESTRYIAADATDPAALRDLLAACTGVPVIYFALPPAVTAKVCRALQDIDLPRGTRLALEKPFGSDEESAAELNAVIATLVPERQVFRIDHFLGKSTVLNILGLRLANRILEPVWNAGSVERVDIVFDETLGLEGRAGYYDSSGALVDMIQSHLLEILAIIAMELPPRVDEVELRDNIAQVLRNTTLWDDDVTATARRARYTAGEIGDRTLPSYVDEPGVDPSRGTETLAELTVAVRTRRWDGVPFLLRSGKALGAKRSQARLFLRPVPAVPGLDGEPQQQVIVLDLMTGDVELQLTMNGAGDPFHLEQSILVAHQGAGDLLPYGQMLRGILDGDPLLSIRGDVAEQCWRIVDPVIAAWRRGEGDLADYPAGSTGPSDW